MRVLGTANVLTDAEIDLILDQALRILEEIGARVPNQRVLSMLAEHDLRVEMDAERVYFPRSRMETFIHESEEAPKQEDQLRFQTGAYPQYYADPRTGKIQEHTQKTAIEMTHLADKMSNATTVYGGMGVPSDVPRHLSPLYMRLTLWKYTQKGWCGKVELTNLLPYILEMSEIMADSQGKPVSSYAIHEWQMISPLQFGAEELIQFLFFYDRGLLTLPGQILSSGGTAPATLAGTLSLQLAEQLILNFMGRAFFGLKHLRMGNSATVIDLKTGVFQYGRPELGLTHLAFGQIARHLGASFGANSFLGDAKAPSCEMGMQKALNAIPAIMAGSRGLGTTGLLSVDEIGSPIQLIIDNEFAEALRRFARGFEVNEETLAFDVIKEVGPGGNFMGEFHTARHFRKEHWQPTLFSREMLNGWMSGDHKTDMERARDVYESIMSEPPNIYIDEDTEKALMKVIEKAEKDLAN
jgi:trimethylamine--corrinoid protein Co-methyltransferase